jgi:hypothetical protein
VTIEAVKDYADRYGPFAFGVLSLLLIWFAVVKPELNRRDLDFDQMNALLGQQKAIVDSMQRISDNQTVTAKLMERTANTLTHTPNVD